MPSKYIKVGKEQIDREAVHTAVETLAQGGLVVLPTETVYGIAARAVDQQAVKRLVDFKQRSANHPFALALQSYAEALDYVPGMGALAERLARRSWPGPITLVFPIATEEDSLVRRLPEISQEVLTGLGTLGIRVPDDIFTLEVMANTVGPLLLTSANHPGTPPATNGEQAAEAVGDVVDLVIDNGPTPYNVPSSVVAVKDSGFEILRAGAVSAETIQQWSVPAVLFVCTGNTCRSPMAQALCRHLLAEALGCAESELDRQILVFSAGIAAATGTPASNYAQQVMAERGIDLSMHSAQLLTDSLVRFADLIFTMTNYHRQLLVAQWPEAAGRTFLLAPDETDVPDPIGGQLDTYRNCAEQIQKCIQSRLDKILALCRKQSAKS